MTNATRPSLELGRSGSASSAPRVLVVDDYAGGREAVCACLSELGYEPIGTSSRIAGQTIRWLEHVDVLVANHDPPWVDGAQLIALLREHAPGLPAILVATDAGSGRDDAITLQKPITIDDLARAIGLVAARS